MLMDCKKQHSKDSFLILLIHTFLTVTVNSQLAFYTSRQTDSNAYVDWAVKLLYMK